MSIRRSFYSQEPTTTDQYMANRLNMTVESGMNSWAAAMPPRKWRTIYHSQSVQPSRLYSREIYKPTKVQKESEWIGKYFIPDGSVPRRPEANNYITEYDIMKHAGMYSYRVLYAVKATTKDSVSFPSGNDSMNGSGWILRSKASIESRPGQLNLILSTQNLILDVQYF